MKYLWLLVTVLSIKSGASFMNIYGHIKEEPYSGDLGEPLILTPLIKQNKIDLARKLSKVHLDQMPNLTSYSGYLTVNEEFNSNLFFWFFPSLYRVESNPVVLWLQGGPGASSMIGLFTEHGPIWIDKQSKLRFRKDAWSVFDYSVIYMDNPVGTGYSFTDEGGYARNQTIIGNQLYVALVQFFQLFPELRKNRFFAAGESYAGKYVPAVAYAIHQNNPTAKHKIHLQGLIIGSGFVDPIHQVTNYSDYFYQNGLIDVNTKKLMEQHEENVVQLIKQNKYLEAYQAFRNLILGDQTFFKNVTGISDHFNYWIPGDAREDIERMGKFIQNSNIRSKIHVGNAKFHSDDVVANYLIDDIMKSVTPWLSELLDYYRVLFYNGQLDIITPYLSTVNFIENLQFSAAHYYKYAPRTPGIYGDQVSEYSKSAGYLVEGIVLNAGHMTARDQLNFASELIIDFTTPLIEN